MTRHTVSLKQFKTALIIAVLLFSALAGFGYYKLDQITNNQQSGFALLSEELAVVSGAISNVDQKVNRTKEELQDTIGIVRTETLSRDDEIKRVLVEIEEQNNLKLDELKEEVNTISVQSGDLSSLVENILPSVVSVLTNVGQGSGVVIDRLGRIVTNYHVIEGATQAAVVDYRGRTYPVRVMGYSKSKDLALLNISTRLPYLEFEKDVKVGERVIAAGNPLGFDFSVTEGIVSGLRTVYGQEFIQHSVAINPGNSGGPLINNKGEVIGINNWKATAGEGLGFAIPAEVVDDFYEELT